MDFVNVLLNFDYYLAEIVSNYGVFTYIILFIIVFSETGFVVATALPGDSLLFAAGALVSVSSLDLFWLWLVFVSAAVLGNSLNFYLGLKFGGYINRRGSVWFLKKEHFDGGKVFIDKYGYRAIVFARFVPFVRSFAPFVFGAGFFDWRIFTFFNVIGAMLWVSFFLFLGYFLGTVDFVEENFILVILLIVLISILPLIVTRVIGMIKK